jgi:hypothetical protein
MYADTYDQKLPPGTFTGDNAPWHSYTAYSVNTSAAEGSHIQGGPWNLAHLYEAKLCPMPEVFYCPSARHIGDTAGGTGIRYQVYKNYRSPDHPWPWNSIGGNLVRTGYMYFPQSKQKEDVHGWKLAEYTNTIHELSSLHTVVTELIHIRELLPHCMGKQAKGVNALFGDAHVNFSTNQDAFVDELWGPRGSGNPGNDPMNFRLILSRLEP